MQLHIPRAPKARDWQKKKLKEETVIEEAEVGVEGGSPQKKVFEMTIKDALH